MTGYAGAAIGRVGMGPRTGTCRVMHMLDGLTGTASGERNSDGKEG